MRRADRRRCFLGSDKVGDVPARDAWLDCSSTPRGSRRRSPTRIDDVDRAMRWGFGWELGPFEIWDAIGVREVLDAIDGPRTCRRPSPQLLRCGAQHVSVMAAAAAAPDACRS